MSDVQRAGQTPSQAMLERLEAVASRADRGGDIRWIPNRLILQNYWLYSYQEFHFADGKLVLRGQNGAGKSTVLTTAVTLALDGDKTPVRMDTFGTNTKAISDYLVGPKDLDQNDPLYSEDSTAFVALEFRRGASDQYKTIGLSVRAERRTSTGQPKLTSWYFLVGDGRRCGRGREIEFSRMDGEGEIMRTQGEMEQVLAGDGNFIGSRQSDYQHEVNRELFGFPTDDGFRYLIQVLLTLRSPKLGKGLKPEEACEMLARALPPLAPALLDKITRLMDDIDATQKRVQETERQRTLVAGVERAQSAVARAHAQLRAVEYVKAGQVGEKIEQEVSSRREDLAEARSRIEEYSRTLRSLDDEAAELRGTLRILQNHEAYRGQEQLRHAALQMEEARQAREQDEQLRDRQAEGEDDASHAVDQANKEWGTGKARQIRTAGEVRDVVESARWPLATTEVARVAERLHNLEPDSEKLELRVAHLTEDASTRTEVLGDLLKALQSRTEAAAEDSRARQRTKDRTEALNEAERREGEAASAVQNRRREAERAVSDWHGQLVVAEISSDPVGRVLGQIAGYRDPGRDPRMVLGPVQGLLSEQRRVVGSERDRARDALGRATDQQAEAEARLSEWREGDHLNVPEPRPGQRALRQQLTEQGIPAVPLYAACEFRPEVDALTAAALESALTESGLLDALVVEGDDAPRVRAIAGEDDDTRADRWILAAPSLGRTLADLLRPSECAIQPSTVEAALRTVNLDGQGPVAVDLTRGWRQGALQGAAPRIESVRFIGETNRRRAWELELRRREAEVVDAAAAVEAGEATVSDLDDRLTLLETEEQALLNLPELGALRNALREHQIREADTATAQVQFNEALQVAEMARKRLIVARQAAEAATAPIPEARGLDESGVQSMIQRIREAVRSLAVLQSGVEGLHFSAGRLRRSEASLIRAREALLEAEHRVTDSDRRLRELQGEYRTIEATLKEGGLDRILEEERRTQNRLDKEIPAERDTLVDTRGKLRQSLQEGEAAIQRLDRQVMENQAVLRTAEAAFGTALRGYPTLADELDRFENESAARAADNLLREPAPDDSGATSLFERVERRVKDHGRALYRALYEDDPAHELDLFRPDVREAEGKFPLVIFRNVETGAGALTPAAFLEVLEREHELNQNLVREKEDELYEAFLYGEVATEVRNAIRSATEANKHVNALLEATPISDRKKIELSWLPFRGVREKGGPTLDYTGIVELLQRSPASLRPEQLKTIKEFFGGHIAEVRHREREGDTTKRFSEALHEVLDYRTWFRYVIRLKDGDAPPVDLTSHRHGKLSGAEQALSVFIPLLAAADARYSDAHASAPKILAMDEAFSGVDATNTAAVWAFMGRLRFSWIMSSEKLWGVGPSLSACSTYQFVKRGSVAAVSHWLWDGQARYRDGILPESRAERSQGGLFEAEEGVA